MPLSLLLGRLIYSFVLWFFYTRNDEFFFFLPLFGVDLQSVELRYVVSVYLNYYRLFRKQNETIV